MGNSQSGEGEVPNSVRSRPIQAKRSTKSLASPSGSLEKSGHPASIPYPQHGEQGGEVASPRGLGKSEQELRQNIRSQLLAPEASTTGLAGNAPVDPLSVNVHRTMSRRGSRPALDQKTGNAILHNGSELSLSSLSADGRWDLQTAVAIIHELRKSASPDDLAALHQALAPQTSKSPTASMESEESAVDLGTSAAALIRRRSLAPPGVATRITIHEPADSVQIDDTKQSPLWKRDMIKTSPLTLIAGRSTSKQPEETTNPRALTPAGLGEYSQLGSLKHGSLMVINGLPSPAPSAITPAQVRKGSDNSDEDFFTASERGDSPRQRYGWGRDARNGVNSTATARTNGRLHSTEDLSRQAVGEAQERSGSPLKHETSISSFGTKSRPEESTSTLSPNLAGNVPLALTKTSSNTRDHSNNGRFSFDASRGEEVRHGPYHRQDHAQHQQQHQERQERQPLASQSSISLADQYMAVIATSPFMADNAEPEARGQTLHSHEGLEVVERHSPSTDSPEKSVAIDASNTRIPTQLPSSSHAPLPKLKPSDLKSIRRKSVPASAASDSGYSSSAANSVKDSTSPREPKLPDVPLLALAGLASPKSLQERIVMGNQSKPAPIERAAPPTVKTPAEETAPTLPNVSIAADAPQVPDATNVPSVQNVQNVSNLPSVPSAPNVPGIRNIPNVPIVPIVPDVSVVEIIEKERSPREVTRSKSWKKSMRRSLPRLLSSDSAHTTNTKSSADSETPKTSSKAKKLQKRRPLSQPPPIDTRDRHALEKGVPRVPSKVFSRYSGRLSAAPSMQYLDSTREDRPNSDVISTDAPVSAGEHHISSSYFPDADETIPPPPAPPNHRFSFARRRSQRRSRSLSRHEDSEEAMAVADFGSVAQQLGSSPYDIATESMRRLSTGSGGFTHPYQLGNEATRSAVERENSAPREGWDAETASKFAQIRSRERAALRQATLPPNDTRPPMPARPRSYHEIMLNQLNPAENPGLSRPKSLHGRVREDEAYRKSFDQPRPVPVEQAYAQPYEQSHLQAHDQPHLQPHQQPHYQSYEHSHVQSQPDNRRRSLSRPREEYPEQAHPQSQQRPQQRPHQQPIQPVYRHSYQPSPHAAPMYPSGYGDALRSRSSYPYDGQDSAHPAPPPMPDHSQKNWNDHSQHMRGQEPMTHVTHHGNSTTRTTWYQSGPTRTATTITTTPGRPVSQVTTTTTSPSRPAEYANMSGSRSSVHTTTTTTRPMHQATSMRNSYNVGTITVNTSVPRGAITRSTTTPATTPFTAPPTSQSVPPLPPPPPPPSAPPVLANQQPHQNHQPSPPPRRNDDKDGDNRRPTKIENRKSMPAMRAAGPKPTQQVDPSSTRDTFDEEGVFGRYGGGVRHFAEQAQYNPPPRRVTTPSTRTVRQFYGVDFGDVPYRVI